MTGPAEVRFDHLVAMTDDHGLFEHAEHALPRLEHGYCTDDNARLLVVASREPDDGPPAALGRVALRFVIAAQDPTGGVRNRMNTSGEWTDTASTEDCWGRSLWGLGTAAAHHGDHGVRAVSMAAFDAGAPASSPFTRALVFAALGAIEVLGVDPGHADAGSLVRQAVLAIGVPRSSTWFWPDERLTYANAALAEVVLAAGALFDDDELLDRGLRMLSWLHDRETRNGHLSPTGTAGAHEHRGGDRFDQQPIEVAAMADACWRAFTLTGDRRWREGVELAAAWFDGVNDAGLVMWDPDTGGCFDGLEPASVNRNQGAESTLALVSTRQRVRSLAMAAR